jgi:transposase
MNSAEAITMKYQHLNPVMDERMRRLWAGSEALAYGPGGLSAVAAATGLSRTTIREGLRELQAGVSQETVVHVRRPGGGRKSLEHHDPELKEALERLVEPVTRGDPESPLRWTAKSTRKLAEELTAAGHPVSPQKVGRLLKEVGYSLQSNQKTLEGTTHPDRNAQFEFINARTEEFQAAGQPVISVDTKKKELVGDFKNGGREWRPQGEPEPVRIHDFVDPELGKIIPYGVYDVTRNQGWVNVGIDHDTPEFAVESIRRWWRCMGRRCYPEATALLITADCGGSNSYRARAWKTELQRFADETNLAISVSHFPPGTSKWNKIEHRLFCHITENWRARPLVDHETVVQLIGNTRTQAGLRVRARLDTHSYSIGIRIPDETLSAVALEREDFHGEWNYTILPRPVDSCVLSVENA